MKLKNKYQKFSKITELKFRRHLADECERQAPLYGIVELNEPYFGAKRIRGRRGHGAGRKSGCLRHFETRGQGLYRDCSRCVQSNAAEGH